MVATANVAVDAVILCVIENWPGAKVLKIGCASRDSRLDGYCLETLCKAIPNWADLEEETQKAYIDAFIKDADIVFSTCASCLKMDVKAYKFSQVIIEEAALQAEEERLSAILKGCSMLIMFGDHQQLRASSNKCAKQFNFNISYFEIMITSAQRHASEIGSSISVTLLMQYRMQSTIADIVSKISYDGVLKTGVTDDDRRPPLGFPWPQKNVGVSL